MKETLDWIIEYMTENGLSEEEVQHFLNSKHKGLENKSVMEYLRTRPINNDGPIKEFVESYMLGM